jgi:hypothetical protein
MSRRDTPTEDIWVLLKGSIINQYTFSITKLRISCPKMRLTVHTNRLVTIEDIILAAKEELKLEYIAITNHTKSLGLFTVL